MKPTIRLLKVTSKCWITTWAKRAFSNQPQKKSNMKKNKLKLIQLSYEEIQHHALVAISPEIFKYTMRNNGTQNYKIDIVPLSYREFITVYKLKSA